MKAPYQCHLNHFLHACFFAPGKRSLCFWCAFINMLKTSSNKLISFSLLWYFPSNTPGHQCYWVFTSASYLFDSFFLLTLISSLLDTSQLVFSFFYHLLNFAIHFPLPGHCFQCDQPAIFSSASLMWLSLPTLFNP